MGLHRTGAGFFIIDQDLNILLLKRAPDSSYPLSWSLPGGSIESADCKDGNLNKNDYSNEEYLNCAVRETYEETDLNFKKIKFRNIHKIFSFNSIHNYRYMTFVISIDNLSNLLKKINLDLDENIEAKSFSFKDLNGMTRHDEREKHKEQEAASMHPGLYDLISEIEDASKKYFKKL